MPLKKQASKKKQKMVEVMLAEGYDSDGSTTQSLFTDPHCAVTTTSHPPEDFGSCPPGSPALLSQAQALDFPLPATHTASQPTSKAATKPDRRKKSPKSPSHTDHMPGDRSPQALVQIRAPEGLENLQQEAPEEPIPSHSEPEGIAV